MKIAFYAPMKPANHPTPSGDRLIAQLLIKALGHAGHTVDVASTFRSRDGAGDSAQQNALQRDGERERHRLIEAFERDGPPELWFSYHLFHKAPDWLGPEIAEHFNIPYVVAEASFAPKQLNGPWHAGHQRVARCLRSANAVIVLNPDDIHCVRPLLSQNTRVLHLAPFIDLTTPHDPVERARIAERYDLDPRRAWLVAVGMMRPGDKLASFQELARVLTELNASTRDWQIVLIGDGDARPETTRAFDELPADQVRFAGRLDERQIATLLPAFDLFVWPAVNEAIGMAMLEAQGSGVPVVSTRTGGVDRVVEDGATGILCSAHDVRAMATACVTLLKAPAQRRAFGERAKTRVAESHSTEAAGRQIGALLDLVSTTHSP